MSQSVKRAPLVLNPTLTRILPAACHVAAVFVETASVRPCWWPAGFPPAPHWLYFLSVEESEENKPQIHAGHVARTLQR